MTLDKMLNSSTYRSTVEVESLMKSNIILIVCVILVYRSSFSKKYYKEASAPVFRIKRGDRKLPAYELSVNLFKYFDQARSPTSLIIGDKIQVYS